MDTMFLHGKPLPLVGGNRRITVSKDLSGGILLDIQGTDPIVMQPQDAVDFSIAIMKLMGIEVNVNPEKKIIHG